MVTVKDTCKGRTGIIAMSLVLMVFMAFPGVALAGIVITTPSSNQTFSETSDFPSRRFADPWDMSQWTDLSYGQYYNDIVNFRFKGGVVSGRTTGTDAYFHPLSPVTGMPSRWDETAPSTVSTPLSMRFFRNLCG